MQNNSSTESAAVLAVHSNIKNSCRQMDVKKIQEFIRKNREILLLLVAIFLLILIGIYVFGFEGSGEDDYHVSVLDPSEEGSSLNNLSTSGAESQVSVDNAPVYSASIFEESDVESIVLDLGFSAFHEVTSTQEMYKVWQRGDDYARYNTETGDFVVSSDPIRLPEIERGYVTEESMVSYFEEFAETYLGIPYDLLISVEPEGSGFRVVAQVVLQDLPVVYAHGQEYALSAKFTEGGDLTDLYANLVEFNETSETVELISTSDMLSYLQLGNYPQESYINIEPSSGSSCETCDPYGFLSPSDFETGTIERVDVVYYYNRNTSTAVLPVYKLTGDGYATDLNDNSRKVSVTIYANAVDPSRIIIPAED